MNRLTQAAAASRVRHPSGRTVPFATLALLGLALPALAGTTPAALIPFKEVHTTTGQSFAIPLSPPIVSSEASGAGQSDLVGPFTTVSRFTLHLGVDGKPLYNIGDAVITAANGDSLSLTIVLLSRPPTTPGVPLFQGVFTIPTGTGRFLGATGSGVVSAELDVKSGKVTITSEGFVTVPKQ